MRIIRRSLTTVSVFALLTSAATIGQPAQAASKVDLAKVQRATGESPTMSFAMTLDMTVPVSGKKVSGRMTASGKTDKAKKASQIDMDLSGFMKAMAGGQALPFAADDLKMSMIALDSKMYVKFGLLNAMSGAKSAKPWAMVDAKAMGVDAGDVMATQGADPTQGLDFLAGLSSSAKEIGKEKVRGVDTTRFDAMVDLATLMKNTPADQQAQAKLMFGNKTSLPVSVWIDDQNRARKMDMAFEVTQQGMTIPAKTSYEFFGFGEPVSITAPPASQVGPNPALEAMIKDAAAKKASSKVAAPKKAA